MSHLFGGETIIKIVLYRAFGRIYEHHFVDKTDEEIYSELGGICSTFEIANIKTFETSLVSDKKLKELNDDPIEIFRP